MQYYLKHFEFVSHKKGTTIKEILRHPKFFIGHVRTATGKIYKTGEFEKRSDRVLGMRLP